MKQWGLVVVFVGALLLATSTPILAEVTTTMFQYDYPLATTAYNPCTSEIVAITGTVHEVYKVTTNANDTYIENHFNYPDVSAVGLTSGLVYRVPFAQNGIVLAHLQYATAIRKTSVSVSKHRQGIDLSRECPCRTLKGVGIAESDSLIDGWRPPVFSKTGHHALVLPRSPVSTVRSPHPTATFLEPVLRSQGCVCKVCRQPSRPSGYAEGARNSATGLGQARLA